MPLSATHPLRRVADKPWLRYGLDHPLQRRSLIHPFKLEQIGLDLSNDKNGRTQNVIRGARPQQRPAIFLSTAGPQIARNANKCFALDGNGP